MESSPKTGACVYGRADWIRGRDIELYQDGVPRQHALNAVAVETGRVWRLEKLKSSRKIDAVVALSFAALDATRLLTAADRGRSFAERLVRPAGRDSLVRLSEATGISLYDPPAYAGQRARSPRYEGLRIGDLGWPTLVACRSSATPRTGPIEQEEPQC